MLEIIDKPLSQVDLNGEPTLDYYYDLYKVGINLSSNLLSYMTMRDWYVWEEPKHLLMAHDHKEEYEKKALKRIFGDLITDSWGDST